MSGQNLYNSHYRRVILKKISTEENANKSQKFNFQIRKLNFNHLSGDSSPRAIPLGKSVNVPNTPLPYITQKSFAYNAKKIYSPTQNTLSNSNKAFFNHSASNPLSPRSMYLLNKKNLFNYQGIKSSKQLTKLLSNPESKKSLLNREILKSTPKKTIPKMRLRKESSDVKESDLDNTLKIEEVYKKDKNDKIIRSFYALTQPGTKGGYSKQNQDSYVTLSTNNMDIFGVFDGHGEFGHIISNYISTYLTNHFTKSQTAENFSKNFTQSALVTHLTQRNSEYIKNLYRSLEKSLEKQPGLSFPNCNYSGSTCVVVFVIGKTIITANAGDSRAILVTNGDIIPLSRDHKPNLKDEHERITLMNGRVERVNPFCGPFRVWVKNQDYPGLAMSRSIGDFVAESIGVICEPEVSIIDLSESKSEAKAIVIGSDGVWEFLSNERVRTIINEHYGKRDAIGAAKDIKNYAKKLWEINGDISDDITVVVIYF